MARLLHLSDLHLTADGRDEDGVDARGSLRQMLHDTRHVPDIDVVVASGDLADDGSVPGYEDALAQVGTFARERGIPSVFATGNHDDRGNFAAVLGSGHLGADGSDVGALLPGGAVRAAASHVGGVRIVTLDSLVPGAVHGLITDDQLTWLEGLLAEPAPNGTVVVLHHPPISPSAALRDVVLRNPADLARVVSGRDVRAILSGHLHHQVSGTLGGVPVWVTPGVLTRIDLTAPPPLWRGVLGASATLVDVADGAATFQLLHARDPRAGELVYLYDPVTGELVDDERVAAEANPSQV